MDYDGNQKLPSGFLKPIQEEGKLQKGFLSDEEAASRYYLAEIVQSDSGTIYFPDQPMAQRKENGEILYTPFRKGIPVEQISQAEYYRAQSNNRLIQNQQMQQKMAYQVYTYQMPMQENCQEQIKQIEAKPCFIPANKTEDNQIFETCYYNPARNVTEVLSNFAVIPEAVVEVYERNMIIKKMLRFRVEMRAKEPAILELETYKIDEVAKKIKEEVMEAIIYNDVSRGEQKLAETLRKKLNNLKTECYQTVPGWMEWRGKKLFAQDYRQAMHNDLKMRTGKRICFELYYKNSVAEILNRILGLGPIEIMAPMVATCLLGPLHDIYKEANVTFEPHYALFVNGKSGSLKTAVSKVVFTMFNADKPVVPASFKDTPTSVEMRLREYACVPVLIDDFYATALSREKCRMQGILEMLIRYVGDGIGKNRSNSKLQDVKGICPSGMVVITGEDTAGEMSTLLRCLILNVDKQTFDKKFYQNFRKNRLCGLLS